MMVLLLLLLLSFSLSAIRLVGSRVLTLTHACKNKPRPPRGGRLTIEQLYER
jgi:hypothetical protein